MTIKKLLGKIRIIEHDKSGNPLQFLFQTEAFEKYIISNENLFAELNGLVDRILIIECEIYHPETSIYPCLNIISWELPQIHD